MVPKGASSILAVANVRCDFTRPCGSPSGVQGASMWSQWQSAIMYSSRCSGSTLVVNVVARVKANPVLLSLEYKVHIHAVSLTVL